MRELLVIFTLIFIVGFPLAYGHPFTMETEPSQSFSAPVGITQVTVHYSEAVEIDFSTLKVYDSNGNQIDSRDTRYFSGEDSLVVSTPPLEDGIYTVTSKVLSKIDGHLVPDAFLFSVGSATISQEQLDSQTTVDSIFYPEAGARFPGLVGQTIVLGAVIASILIWGTQRKDLIKEELENIQKSFHSKFMTLIGFGLVAVFASNFLILAVQTYRLETSALDALQTSFGMTWIIRMEITIALLVVWFIMERKKSISIKSQIPLLIISLALIATTTMMGHGAASEQVPAIALDYIHNLVAAVWIGGVIFFAFVLLPVFSNLDSKKRELISLATIPKFSIMIVISLGIVIITGPTLMWFLESNVGLITESTYGKLLMAKIAIAGVMIGIGGYNQLKIQKNAENNLKSEKIVVVKKLRRSLKAETALGVLLLGVVALLTNGSLPAGEIQDADAQIINYGFRTLEFSESIKYDIEIDPFTSGKNILTVKVRDFDGGTVQDISNLKVKISNPSRNISPIEVLMEENDSKYQGEITFGFSGNWQMEIEVQRTENANESVILDLGIKPRLENLEIEIIEYELPEAAGPLYPVYDGNGAIWISDSTAPKLWKFTIDDKQFRSFEFDGVVSISLAIDNDGKIWFTDIPQKKIGFFDPKTEEFNIISLPELQPLITAARPVFLEVDSENNIWVSVPTKNTILKYDQDTKEFNEYRLLTTDSGPFGLLYDPNGKMWFTQTLAGQIGYIDLNTNEIKEIPPPVPFSILETITFGDDGNIWISEHDVDGGIIKFNPILETYEKIPAPDTTALPNDPTFDKYQNIWFAQHTVDKLAVYDPSNNDFMEIPVLTQTSFIQFMTTDGNENIWFAEQRGNKIGTIKITEKPSLGIIQAQNEPLDLKYTEIASPLMALGILATSLFFVKSVRDKRRINDLVYD